MCLMDKVDILMKVLLHPKERPLKEITLKNKNSSCAKCKLLLSQIQIELVLICSRLCHRQLRVPYNSRLRLTRGKL